MSNAYWKYWGKAADGPDGYHLLAYHSMDVAAMGKVVLRSYPHLHERAARVLGLRYDQFEALWLYCLALHDLGKFSFGFQLLVPSLAARLGIQETSSSYGGNYRHDTLGFVLWNKKFAASSPVLLESEKREQSVDGLRHLLSTTMGHHGRPPFAPFNDKIRRHFSPTDIAAVGEFIEASAFLCPEPVELTFTYTNMYSEWAEVSWYLAGLATFSDWLGSDRTYFNYPLPDTASLESYFEQALKSAEDAAAGIGLGLPTIRKATGVHALLGGKEPRPLQKAIDLLECPDDSQLLLIEDLTGSGKTEAALGAAQRMVATGVADGIYFALPTTATANAMHERVERLANVLFDEEQSTTLVHSKSGLAWALRTGLSNGQEEKALDRRPNALNTASSDRMDWYQSSRKRALLSRLGVGTLDQALLGGLLSNHNCLRLLGLHRKVLIVDELHAFDAYTLKILGELLRRHFRMGGHAIVMTATLPLAESRKLVELIGAKPPEEDAYPRLIQATKTGARVIPLEDRPDGRRTVKTRLVHSEEQVVERLLAAVKAGKAACWIRNTVDQAIQTWEMFQEILGDNVTLCHARFTVQDRLQIENQLKDRFGPRSTAQQRAGQLVIATQVIEQSMDLDFDVLASDLCPIDLLLQRDGRRQRHGRSENGDRAQDGFDKRNSEPLIVLSPEFTTDPQPGWFKTFSPKSSPIYPHHYLWLTCRWLVENPGFVIPDRLRACIEYVYASTDGVPNGLQNAAFEFEAEAAKRRGLGLRNAGWEDAYYPGMQDWEHTEPRTRDGLDSVTCRVARWKDGQLVPWNETGDDSIRWPLNELALLAGIVSQVSYTSEALGDACKSLAEHWRDRYVIIVPRETTTQRGTFQYDSDRGGHFVSTDSSEVAA